MKRRSRQRPLKTKEDTPAMMEAVKEIKSWGYGVVRPTSFQLKINDVSYYPDAGTIVRDGKRQEKQKGLDNLLILLVDIYGQRKSIASLSLELDSHDH